MALLSSFLQGGNKGNGELFIPRASINPFATGRFSPWDTVVDLSTQQGPLNPGGYSRHDA